MNRLLHVQDQITLCQRRFNNQTQPEASGVYMSMFYQLCILNKKIGISNHRVFFWGAGLFNAKRYIMDMSILLLSSRYIFQNLSVADL